MMALSCCAKAQHPRGGWIAATSLRYALQ